MKKKAIYLKPELEIIELDLELSILDESPGTEVDPSEDEDGPNAGQ